ncbi:MAG: exodeoxyribonuclease VII large subunit [Gammaproteobacteria bacterium]|nr:exodeoxyribonuclease VII large subunit [Gammaproteobacteria bacterium]
MFKNRALKLATQPENGMQVLVRANVSLYEGRGEFQLIVEYLEPAGAGALQRQFEELKKKLDAEGLFDPAAQTIDPGHADACRRHYLAERRGHP